MMRILFTTPLPLHTTPLKVSIAQQQQHKNFFFPPQTSSTLRKALLVFLRLCHIVFHFTSSRRAFHIFMFCVCFAICFSRWHRRKNLIDFSLAFLCYHIDKGEKSHSISTKHTKIFPFPSHTKMTFHPPRYKSAHGFLLSCGDQTSNIVKQELFSWTRLSNGI